jgi:hypothetical protein
MQNIENCNLFIALMGLKLWHDKIRGKYIKDIRKECVDNTWSYFGTSNRKLERGTVMTGFMICTVRRI